MNKTADGIEVEDGTIVYCYGTSYKVVGDEAIDSVTRFRKSVGCCYFSKDESLVSARCDGLADCC